MKTILFSALTISLLVFSACGNDASQHQHNNHDSSTASKEQHASSADSEIKTVAAVYSGLDAKAAASIKEIVDHYLHVKNALANDNANEAVSGAKAMSEAISKLDKSLLTAEQKTAFDKTESSLKQHADLLANSGADIKQQRTHFVALSEAAYDLVKNFGGGRALYHDHCPMARNNQGALWISELKEVKNPYFGAEMLECGRVEEVIQ